MDPPIATTLETRGDASGHAEAWLVRAGAMAAVRLIEQIF